MKLNLGCGNKKIPYFINIDIREDVNPDIIDDITKLASIQDNCVDLLYASHVLEHFGRHEYKKILERWYQVLKPNGILRISVPNFESICKYYDKTKDINKLIGLLYGGQNYQENYHYMIWDFESLKKDLIDIKFKDVFEYDWRSIEHSNIDDYSQSYLPHMDKENGLLMSLNIQAIK